MYNQTIFIVTLDAVVTSAETALATLAAAGEISPETAATVETYLTEVGAAAASAAVELESGDTTAEKYAKIAAEFAAIALPNLTGVPAGLLISVIAVSTFIQTLLASLRVAGAHTTAVIADIKTRAQALTRSRKP